MQTLILIFRSALILLLLNACSSQKLAREPVAASPPVAKAEDKVLVAHGDQRVDPYFWMNQRDSKGVLEYIDQENSYTKTVLAPSSGPPEFKFEPIRPDQ